MKTVLIVEDDQQYRGMLAASLRRHSYRVLEAKSGPEGLALARQHLPDLVLSDINMPGGDGTTLLRELRMDLELRSKQVVLMTGRPDLVTPRRGMEEGADDFLVKPVDLEALLACVEARFKRASISWRVEDRVLDHLRNLIPANLPHEFFTPMAGILGLVEILREDFSALALPEVHEIHNGIYDSALKLNRTLRNYLAILDLQTLSTEPLLGLLDSRIVEETIYAGINEALLLNKRKEDLTVRIASCAIYFKAADLSRVVEELVDNACKFSRKGTPVEVELSPKGHLLVRDRGRGLTAEHIRQIGSFKQFDRQKYEQQGLGLGLFLVRKLSEVYGATLTIDSEAGMGTCVHIEFATELQNEGRDRLFGSHI